MIIKIKTYDYYECYHEILSENYSIINLKRFAYMNFLTECDYHDDNIDIYELNIGGKTFYIDEKNAINIEELLTIYNNICYN